MTALFWYFMLGWISCGLIGAAVDYWMGRRNLNRLLDRYERETPVVRDAVGRYSWEDDYNPWNK